MEHHCLQLSRIHALEKENIRMHKDIEAILARFDKLTGSLEKLFWMLIPVLTAILGYLTIVWVTQF